MVNQRPGAGPFTVIFVGLMAGLVGGAVGALAVLRFADTAVLQAALIQSATSTPHPGSTPTMQLSTPSPTVTPLPSPTVTAVPDIDELTVRVVEATQGSVVTVVNLLEEAGQPGGVETRALGSGIVLDRDGHVVTNEHVVRAASSLRVILPTGEETAGTTVGVDALTDLAVVKVEGYDLAPVTFGNSSTVRPGERVIAIGTALGGFWNTVTVGVVSGLGRQVIPKDKEYALENLIQTDAAINHGNSGGPLLNLRGEVIGVNTILIRRERDSDEIVQGIGFAIPSNTVREIVAQLVARGRVPRPYLGVETRTVTRELKATYALSVDHGARVEEVVPGSPAETAGLRRGDVILAINGESIDEENPFVNILMHYDIGESVELLVNRVGDEITLTATLGESPVSQAHPPT